MSQSGDHAILPCRYYTQGQEDGHLLLNEQKNAQSWGPHLIVQSRSVADPSTLDPDDGQWWIVATSGIGDWFGQDDKAAGYYGDVWIVRSLIDRETLTVLDEGNGSPTRGKVFVNKSGTLTAVYTCP